MGMVRLRLGEGIELPDNVALGSANRFVSLNEKVPAFEQDHRCGRSGTGGPPLHHLLIAVALLAAVGLDLIFVTFSGEPSAALTFALLSYFIMLLLSGSAGSYVPDMPDYTTFLGPLVREGMQGFVSRLLLAYSVPAVLLLLVAFIPSLADPLTPSATVQLGSTLAVFWLLMSLGLVGVVQGFLWPHSGVFQAVIVGGLVVLTQGLLSWAKVDAGREELQLALYTWMVWVSICLIGAWVGLLLREVSGLQPRGTPELPGEELPAYAQDIREE